MNPSVNLKANFLRKWAFVFFTTSYFTQPLLAEMKRIQKSEKKFFAQVNPFDYLHLLPNLSFGAAIHPKITGQIFYQMAPLIGDHRFAQGFGTGITFFGESFSKSNPLMRVKLLYADYFQSSPLTIEPQFRPGLSYSVSFGYQWLWPSDIFLQGSLGLAFIRERDIKGSILSHIEGKNGGTMTLKPVIEIYLGYFVF